LPSNPLKTAIIKRAFKMLALVKTVFHYLKKLKGADLHKASFDMNSILPAIALTATPFSSAFFLIANRLD